MLRPKKSLALLLTLCLNGCNTPQVRDLEQKNIRLILEVDQETGRRYVNEDESACFSRMYRHSKEYVGPIGQEATSDVTHCNDSVGYDSADYVDLSLFFEEVRIEVNKNPKKEK